MSETKKTRIHREFFKSRTPRHDKILRQMLKYNMIFSPYSTWQWEIIAKDPSKAREYFREAIADKKSGQVK